MYSNWGGDLVPQDLRLKNALEAAIFIVKSWNFDTRCNSRSLNYVSNNISKLSKFFEKVHENMYSTLLGCHFASRETSEIWNFDFNEKLFEYSNVSIYHFVELIPSFLKLLSEIWKGYFKVTLSFTNRKFVSF